jgi:hypothetical protein
MSGRHVHGDKETMSATRRDRDWNAYAGDPNNGPEPER